MGLIKETINHLTIDHVELVVYEQEPDEVSEEWEIINLDVGFASVNTPHQLIELGRWLMEQGTRISKEYTSTGKKINE